MYSKKDYILIIDDDILFQECIKNYLAQLKNVELITTTDPIEGIRLFQEFFPCIVILDANMPVLNGFNVCSIIRKMKKGDQSTIYMASGNREREQIEQAYKVGVDYYFEKPLNESIFVGMINKYFEKREQVSAFYIEVERARKQQESMLPTKITTNNFTVDHIFSPYEKLSGDFVDYWLSCDKQGVFGYIFDVPGHDIASAMQVTAIRALFKNGFTESKDKDISSVLKYVNNQMFDLYDNPDSISALVFQFDFKNNTLYFCGAGIPCFYVVSQDQYIEIQMNGYLVGYKKNSDYNVKSIKVDNISEIIFSSDGFSELLLTNSLNRFEKHDDVSAIMIHFKKNEGEFKNEIHTY